MMRRFVAVSVLAIVASGCPEPRKPQLPSEARACERHEDCNCGADCGALSACVDGFCEDERSMLVPCRERQTPRADDCE